MKRNSYPKSWMYATGLTLLLAALLSACASPEATLIASTATFEPTRAPLPTLIPSATRRGTTTPRPKSSSTAVYSPTPVSGILGLPVVSIDQRWTALTIRQPVEGQDSFVLKVTHLTNGKVWEIEPLPANGSVYAGPVRFSKDTQSLYYTHRTNGFTACAPQSQPGGSGLYRLDLQTGETQQISSQSGPAWLALSPNEGTLALLDHSSTSLTLVELPLTEVIFDPTVSIPTVISQTGGTPRTLPAPLSSETAATAIDVGNIVWSPDSTELVYTIFFGDCREKVYLSTAIVRAATNGAQTVIIPPDQRGLTPLRWNADGMIIAADKQGWLWRLDPQNGRLVAIPTSTPVPPTPTATQTPDLMATAISIFMATPTATK